MSEESIDMRVYVQAIFRWWWLLLLGPIIGAGLALSVSLLGSQTDSSAILPLTGIEPVIYEAKTIIYTGGESQLGSVSELVTTKPVLEYTIRDPSLSL